MIGSVAPNEHKKNAMIYHEGEEARYLYIVQSGRVRATCYHANGSEKQLYILQPGAMFGESSCLFRDTYSVTSEAIVDSRVFKIPKEQAVSAMMKDWRTAMLVMESIGRKEKLLQRQVVDLSFADSAQRVAKLLLDLGEEYGEATEDGLRISVPFTQQDMANMARTSRVTVNNTFQDFYSESILSKKNGRFYLNRLELLRELAIGHREKSPSCAHG
jgi:CRP/FNR family transcriptional regulator